MSILLAIVPSLNHGHRGDALSPMEPDPPLTACADHTPPLLAPLALGNCSDNSGSGPLSQTHQSLRRSHSYERGQESEAPSPDRRALSERNFTTLHVIEYLQSLAAAPIIKPPSLSLSQHDYLPPSPSISNQSLLEENDLSPPILTLQEDSAIHFEDGPDLAQKGANPGLEITAPFPPMELGLSWNKSDALAATCTRHIHHLPRNAVGNSISSSTLLTTELSTIGDGVRTTYRTICECQAVLDTIVRVIPKRKPSKIFQKKNDKFGWEMPKIAFSQYHWKCTWVAGAPYMGATETILYQKTRN
ncbi:hypothetical protein BJ912DRAFT_925737 [Pholiota molesta]|nr:hypothetical protein BJ912DRAFT_925737 [Pholiota molesta]